MLFDIPEEKLSIARNVCIEDTLCPNESKLELKACSKCPHNLIKYKVEGKNPIFQRVYDKYKDRPVRFADELHEYCGEMWKAIKTYIEDK